MERGERKGRGQRADFGVSAQSNEGGRVKGVVGWVVIV